MKSTRANYSNLDMCFTLNERKGHVFPSVECSERLSIACMKLDISPNTDEYFRSVEAMWVCFSMSLRTSRRPCPQACAGRGASGQTCGPDHRGSQTP